MKKKIVGSYPYANVLFSISAALFMIALFALFALGTTRLANRLSSGLEMQVILEKNLSNVQKDTLLAQIKAFEFVAVGEEPIYISKEEAAELMKESTGEDFVKFIGDNPLRDAFAVRVNIGLDSDEELLQSKKSLENLGGVYEVIYTNNLIRSVRNNMEIIGGIIIGLSVIFFVIAIMLINNSIRLALFSQRFLIRSMQLVGATQMFIKKPFLVRGAIQGAIGGLIASVLLLFISTSTISSIPQVSKLLNTVDVGLIALFSIILGTFVVVSSVYFSISKYLKMKLDDLY
ncbi:ABC transporter permease [Flammeovirga sp. MY04]|uniref:cell division protein FtsX n=1 Tax=Flammeovirga sp. MY04 TaxID=1191459 RepID=UPI0008060945|nr:permease-like cell division protein FtsX [Flammeovirga sp. MY04]ANQ47724.1 ABC transporter permease [Flammeovirga sp. MY04]